jgi:hypothetical protein
MRRLWRCSPGASEPHCLRRCYLVKELLTVLLHTPGARNPEERCGEYLVSSISVTVVLGCDKLSNKFAHFV